MGVLPDIRCNYVHIHYYGGPIPDNMFLILIGAAAIDNGMSMEGLIVVAVLGGFAG